MEINVRQIQKRDYQDALKIWNNEIGNQYFTEENFSSHHDRFKENENAYAFVAELENRIVGIIYIMQCAAWGVDGDYFWIQCIAVKEDMQGRGIGTKLLNHIEKLGQKKGVEYITLNTGIHRTAAHVFYERNGYKSGNYCFGKKL